MTDFPQAVFKAQICWGKIGGERGKKMPFFGAQKQEHRFDLRIFQIALKYVLTTRALMQYNASIEGDTNADDSAGGHSEAETRRMDRGKAKRFAQAIHQEWCSHHGSGS